VLFRSLAKRGFVQGEVIGRWREIIGPRLADHTSPEKLTFPQGERNGATLYVRVASGLALEIQHDQPNILDRINAYFGYRAVAGLKIIQAPVPRPARAASPQRRKLRDEEIAAIKKEVANTQDDDLRNALEKLGRSLHSAPPRVPTRRGRKKN
jgi:hypothetical protein